MSAPNLSRLLQGFFTDRLVRQQQASPTRLLPTVIRSVYCSSSYRNGSKRSPPRSGSWSSGLLMVTESFAGHLAFGVTDVAFAQASRATRSFSALVYLPSS